MATKKYVSPSKLSFFLEKLKNVFAAKDHTHKMSDVSDVDSYAFITTDDIDEICGATIVSADEAVF